jgi:two-component system chemotaxis response regulator CheB
MCSRIKAGNGDDAPASFFLTQRYSGVFVVTVLVVDDSVFMRNFLSAALSKDPEITVVGTAKDGDDGLEKIKRLNPNVVTLDVEMPRRDGLTTLQEIMQVSPRPVIMVSSATVEGAEITLKCLDAGALDFIPKNTLNTENFVAELLPKIKAVARKRAIMALRRASAAPARHNIAAPGGTRGIVAVGVSTGGPPAVHKVLSGLPGDLPAAVLIAQHMPAAFTGPFAKRLDAQCALDVKEAEHGEKIRPGSAYIAPGGRHMSLEKRGTSLEVHIDTEPASELYKPSATVLFNSVARISPQKTLGVILTGMGSDGCAGIRALKENGGYVLAQSEASCVVYGMPKAVIDAGLADQILDIDEMSGAILAAVQGK